MSENINSSSVQELLNLIGEDAFSRLCTVFGGTRLHISNSERSRKRLIVIIGEDASQKAIAHFNGCYIEIPMLSSIEIMKRHREIIEDSRNGMSHREIAMKFDITERQARRILADS